MESERVEGSVSNDVVHAITHGKVKTGKYLTLGLALKSMMGAVS